MRFPGFNIYDLSTSAHWLHGAYDALTPQGDALVSPSPWQLARIVAWNDEEAGAVLAAGPCGVFYWLVRVERILYRLDPNVDCPLPLGELTGASSARQLLVGRRRIWLLSDGAAHLFAATNLQWLASISESDALDGTRARLLALSRLPDDTVSVLAETEDGRFHLLFLDEFGRTERILALSAALTYPLAAETSPDGTSMAIIDREARLLIFLDLGTGDVRSEIDFDAIGPEFRPRFLSWASDGRLFIAMASGSTLILDREGRVLERVPGIGQTGGDVGIRALTVSAGDILIWDREGIARLRRGGQQDGETVATGAFITPTLCSPEQQQSGWQRADIHMALPEGTSLEVNIANTDNRSLAEAITRTLADRQLSGVEKFRQVDNRLGRLWQAEPLHGGGPELEDGTRPIRVLLDQEVQPYLWLKLCISRVGGAPPARLGRLRVLYPRQSYLRYLPAVYQFRRHLPAADDDPASLRLLRRYLAIFETLFGDLEAAVESLGEKIDPQTAPAAWLDFLARWLALPVNEGWPEVAKRAFLSAAGEILGAKGTRAGLERAIAAAMTVGGAANLEVQVRDVAGWASPLVLNAGDGDDQGLRLGQTTVLLGHGAPQPRLGRSSALGRARLGETRSPAEALAGIFGSVSVSLSVTRAELERRRNDLERLIRNLVPAQIHVALRTRPPPINLLARADHLAGYGVGRRLDENVRLGGLVPGALGESAILGRLVAISPDRGEARLGMSTDLGLGFRLS